MQFSLALVCFSCLAYLLVLSVLDFQRLFVVLHYQRNKQTLTLLKLLGKILLGGGGILAVYHLWAYQRLAQSLVVETRPDFNPSTMGLVMNVKLKNPVNKQITIQQPFVEVHQNGKILATSQVSNRPIQIPARAEVNLEHVRLQMQASNALTAVMDWLKRGGSVEVETKTKTALITPIGPFDVPAITDVIKVK